MTQMINLCPECNNELDWDGNYLCLHCDKHYEKKTDCPDCNGELEKLQACGAANYFCNHCNELKSKSRLNFRFVVKS